MQEQTKSELPITETTSLAREELDKGVKVDMPSPEELARRANSSFVSNMVQLENILKSGKLSSRGITRAVMAILDLPVEGLPVRLKGDYEKAAFAIGQRIIRDRFIMTQYHISQEQKIYNQLLSLKSSQDSHILKMKEEGKSEEEIKDMQDKHKQAMLTLEKTLRGEEVDETEIPLVTETNKEKENE